MDYGSKYSLPSITPKTKKSRRASKAKAKATPTKAAGKAEVEAEAEDSQDDQDKAESQKESKEETFFSSIGWQLVLVFVRGFGWLGGSLVDGCM
mgnify:CR=1 FL=1